MTTSVLKQDPTTLKTKQKPVLRVLFRSYDVRFLTLRVFFQPNEAGELDFIQNN